MSNEVQLPEVPNVPDAAERLQAVRQLPLRKAEQEALAIIGKVSEALATQTDWQVHARTPVRVECPLESGVRSELVRSYVIVGLAQKGYDATSQSIEGGGYVFHVRIA